MRRLGGLGTGHPQGEDAADGRFAWLRQRVARWDRAVASLRSTSTGRGVGFLTWLPTMSRRSYEVRQAGFQTAMRSLPVSATQKVCPSGETATPPGARN